MKPIPWWKELGDIGESAVKLRLLYFSIPMKPPRSQEVGLDFYCRLKKDGVPTSHIFLVQAKGTQHFNEVWSRNIKRDIVSSWLEQIYPVYLIVYDEIAKKCYWMSVEEKRNEIFEELKSDKATVHIDLDRSKTLEEDNYGKFVERITQDIDSIRFRLNLIQGSPQLIGRGYVKGRPILYLSKELAVRIKDRIRIGLDYLVSHYLLEGDEEKAYSYCKFLTEFDRGHYDHFLLFGSICEALRKTEEACLSYSQAVRVCEGDKNWDRLKDPSDLSMKEIIAFIRKKMDNLNCRHT